MCDQKAMQTNAEHKRIATHKGAAMATKFCGSYKSCLSTLYASHTLSLAGPYTRDSTIANQNAIFYLELTWHPLFYRKLTWQIILASHPSSVRVQVLAIPTTQSRSFIGQFVKKDEPDSGDAGPSRVPTYSERIGKVTVEEFELPSCYDTGFGLVARNVCDDESSDSSDDDEIAHGLSHHEKRLLKYEARLKRWNKRNPGHDGSIPSREFYFSDESSSIGSSSDDTWVTDDSGDENTASVDPAFDRHRLQQRYSSALRRAGMRRSRPRSYASFVRMANRTIWSARNRTYFRPTGELSPSDFSIRIAGHIVTWTRRSSGYPTSISDAQCYASLEDGPGRSSHVPNGHRWLVDSGANNHMVTEESDCTSDITPASGFITGVSVDIVGQGNCEIFVTS